MSWTAQFLNIQNKTSARIEIISWRIVTYRRHQKRTREGRALSNPQLDTEFM